MARTLNIPSSQQSHASPLPTTPQQCQWYIVLSPFVHIPLVPIHHSHHACVNTATSYVCTCISLYTVTSTHQRMWCVRSALRYHLQSPHLPCLYCLCTPPAEYISPAVECYSVYRTSGDSTTDTPISTSPNPCPHCHVQSSASSIIRPAHSIASTRFSTKPRSHPPYPHRHYDRGSASGRQTGTYSCPRLHRISYHTT